MSAGGGNNDSTLNAANGDIDGETTKKKNKGSKKGKEHVSKIFVFFILQKYVKECWTLIIF